PCSRSRSTAGDGTAARERRRARAAFRAPIRAATAPAPWDVAEPARAHGSVGAAGPAVGVRTSCLDGVPAFGHRAPAAGPVAGRVVVGPPARVLGADLQPFPGSLLGACADGIEETGQRPVCV